jgi:hypothetical protein
MLYTLATFLLPPLLVFGVYHVLLWLNVLRINERVFWKRVAIASAVSHFVLVSGFFAFSYIDASNANAGTDSFGMYLFNRSGFWRLLTIFDTVPMLVTIGLFSAFDRAGMNPPGLVAIAIAITYVIGTLQWFFVGGGIGALLERFFEGLKTPEPEDEDWSEFQR